MNPEKVANDSVKALPFLKVSPGVNTTKDARVKRTHEMLSTIGLHRWGPKFLRYLSVVATFIGCQHAEAQGRHRSRTGTRSVGITARLTATALCAAVLAFAGTPTQAQTVTIEKISGKGSFDAGATTRTVGSLTDIGSTAHFRIRARGSDAPFQRFTGDRGEFAGITIGVKFDYQGRDLESWRNSNYTTHPGNKISRFEVVLARAWEASGSVAGNRIWDVAEVDMGNANLHLIGPVIVRLYDPPGGRDYSLGSSTEICLVINESDGTAGEPCSSSQLRSVQVRERLTGSFDSLPASHDGQTAFSFRIQFSEDIDATVDGMRDHALTVSGGTVTGAARVNKRDDLWSFTITPSGDAKVEIILAGGASCDADGAICTSDGRQLSTGLLTFVSGPLPTLSIGDAEAYEGVDEHMTFMVSMDRAVTERSWFNYATADGTAEAGSDYTAKSGQLWYLGPDDTGKKGEHKNWLINVPIIDDTVEDDGETFTVTLSNPKGVTISRGVATGTIRNSEDPVEISIADAEATEGEDGWMRFRLSLNRIAKDVTVDYATADGTATAGVDYVATSGSVVIRKGTINTEITVPILRDSVEDDGETFTLTLSNVSGAEFTDSEAIGTVWDGEAVSTVSTISTGPLWSADMEVVDFGNGSIGGWGADKFSNVGGTDDLEAKWLWYHTGDRKLHLAFTTAIADTTGLSLYMGDVAVAFADGGNDSSFSWTDVDIAWTDGETVPVRIARGSAVVVEPPANTAPTGLPTVSGTPQVGETLTASTDAIADADGQENAAYAYQWIANNGTADADITGATGTAYTPVDGDAGKTIKVRVTFTDDGGTQETLVSIATEAVAAAQVVNTAPTGSPSITGTPQVGQTLTAGTSAITDADGLANATYSYQWLADGVAIAGATGTTYTPVAADKDKVIRLRVTFTDDGGTQETLVSAPTIAIAAKPNSPAAGVPTITGTPQVGQTLTAVTSGITDADGLANATYSYQWQADGVAIAGATGTTYTPVAADKDKVIRLRVTFTDDGGTQETLVSAPTVAIAAKPNSPAAGVPTITGTPKVGQTLTAVTSGITDADGLANATYSYQWLADGVAIAGATGGTYSPVAADKGKVITVRLTFTDDGGTQETLVSAATDAVTAVPLTASFEDVPAEHDGSKIFTFRVRFSREPSVSYRVLRDHGAFTVIGGTVKRATRVNGRNDLREIHIEPSTDGAVTVTLVGGRACDTTGAVCTADGEALSNSPSAVIPGPETPRTLTGTDDDDTLSGRSGDDTLSGAGGDDVLDGQGGEDELYGDAGADDLYGGDDDDLLYGGAGDDTLYGDSGDDELYGDAGDDELYGGTGDDELEGGAGTDTLTGGAGADTFVFAAGHGTDTITDFNPEESDLIDVSAFAGITAFAGLSLTDDEDTVLDLGSHGGGAVRLEGVSVADLEAADFGLP